MKTARGYEWALDHACTAFGAKPIATVTRSDVEQLIFALADARRAQSTATLVLFVIRSVFEDAIEDSILSRNPAKSVRPVGRKAKEQSVLNTATSGPSSGQTAGAHSGYASVTPRVSPL